MHLNLHDYYLGIIKCHEDKYPKKKTNSIGWEINHPFINTEKDVALEVGIPTVVIKEKDGTYRDIIHSNFKKEFSYKLNKFNKKGIVLTHTKPFLAYYDDLSKYPMIYKKAKNQDTENLRKNLPYIILPNLDRSECMILNNIKPMEIFYEQYITDLYKKEKRRQDDPFNLENYYLGIITCDENYYKRKSTTRFIGNINFDPFEEVGLEEGIKHGVPTLLYKKEGIFYDIMWNRYEKELIYKKNTTNHFGIKLIHTEPFLRWYPFKDFLTYPIITGKAKTQKAFELQCQMPFLASYNPKMNYFDIELLDDEPMYNMYQTYYEKGYQKKRK